MRKLGLAVFIVLGFAFGCTGDRQLPMEPRLPVVALTSTANEDSLAIHQLGLMMAEALAVPESRGWLAQAFARSTVKEGKLHLRSIVADATTPFGRRLVDIARGRGLTLPDVIAATGRDLELYMPIQEHRRAWGIEEVIVVVQLNEDDIPIGFMHDGTVLPLSLNAPPHMPTVVVVPAESFDPNGVPRPRSQRPTGMAECYENCTGDDPGGGSGCDSCGGDGDDSPTTPPSALYLSYLNLSDVHEPWPRGDPELEIHVMGPEVWGSRALHTHRCAGGDEDGIYHWQMNDDKWWGDLDGGEGDQYLASIPMLDSIRSLYPPDVPLVNRVFVIQVWEDDQQSCLLVKSDVDDFTFAMSFMSANGLTALALAWTNPLTAFAAAAAVIVHSFTALAAAGIGEDDFVGHFIKAEEWEAHTGGSTLRGYVVVRGFYNKVGVANMTFK